MTRREVRDAVVVGAGPAGLAATAVLAAQGLSVRLIDEQSAVGGQVWRGVITRPADAPPLSGAAEARRAHAAAAASRRAGVDHAAGASVIDARRSGIDGPDGAIEMTWLAARDAGGRVMHDTRARALVIATGAMERPVLFPGATLPGVMGVGAVQSAMKRGGLVPDGPGVVLAGHGPLLQLTLSQLRRLGTAVEAVLDLAPDVSVPGERAALASDLARALRADPALLARGATLLAAGRRTRRYRCVHELRAHGERAIERISFVATGVRRELPCRLLAVHDGVVPNVQITRLLRLEHRWQDGQQAFVPVTDAAGRVSELPIWVAGDGGGIAGAPLATLRGRLAGLDLVRALRGVGASTASASDTVPELDACERRLHRAIDRRLPARRFVDRVYPALPIDRHATPDTIVCRCEAVTLGAIDAAIAAGALGANRVKTFTRCGMGACQGRLCANALTRIVADRLGVAPDAAGALRVRPPLVPTLIGDYLAGDRAVGEPLAGSGHADTGTSPVARGVA